ncbi:Hypothetical Protein RradSPS_2050 [Rubrobacter radiotolerans]|uniref:Uncharacterized protein n=1 Tax=Rubrobacter radiotolerans TaxID=42256 RepID=A0A023X4Q8_RUBRA|nr:hypothetical protein [Rubrobacter radiotolerans]AHY47333.1 Hypothetical Protein RradSPS_2050 [Rubrobacter radiotolerans]MDX5894737.1 hypothetical protein [Rubrobacter radiotolerans]SMC06642.1 conserved hypothetical protein [Rubrobacter radiotolerans DSM 5868]
MDFMSAEIIQFVGAMIFLLGVLIGAYWFVYAPIKRENREREERRRDRENASNRQTSASS